MTRDEVKRLQVNLKAKGFDPGKVDGYAGPVTYGALFSYMAGRTSDVTIGLGHNAGLALGPVGINTPLRLAHFLAQCSHETGRFRFMRELWGPTPAQTRYEGRADLGNMQPGDGFRFRGRGIFQLTGRDNYRRYGQRLGIDLIGSPDLAAQPDAALRTACLYWKDHNLNLWADADNVLAVSNGINRGNAKSTKTPNGYDDRRKELARAKAVLL